MFNVCEFWFGSDICGSFARYRYLVGGWRPGESNEDKVHICTWTISLHPLFVMYIFSSGMSELYP